MSGNNTNIMEIQAAQGLLLQAAKCLKKIEPDKSDPNVFSEQTIAKESALRWLEILIDGDFNKLQQVYE